MGSNLKKNEPHYYRWRAMRERCERKSHAAYSRYGGRGIRVCREWQDFCAFQAWCLATYEPGKTLDRVNNNAGYSPKNCRWATRSEQQLNSRQTEKRKKSNLRLLKLAVAENLRRQRKKYGDPRTRKSKRCPVCVTRKSLEFFALAKVSLDGRANYCKPCYNAKYWPRKERL